MLLASHDAASYRCGELIYRRKVPGIHALYIVRQFEGHDFLLAKVVYTQDQDLEQQLQLGARFLDIRIGYCECSHSTGCHSFSFTDVRHAR